MDVKYVERKVECVDCRNASILPVPKSTYCTTHYCKYCKRVSFFVVRARPERASLIRELLSLDER